MSSILLVSAAGPAPDFLSLLSHDLGTAASAEEALRRMDLVDAVVVDEGDALRALVPVGAVAVVQPLPGPAPVLGGERAGLASVLRVLARQGLRVRLQLGAVEVVGRIVRVAADHLDVITDAEEAGAQRVSVALGALEAVRSR